MREPDGRLKQFFGGYFHQDWDVDGARSWEDVLETYVKEVPREAVTRLVDDLRSLVTEMDTEGFTWVPADLGCDYDSCSDRMTGRDWIVQMIAHLERRIHGSLP